MEGTNIICSIIIFLYLIIIFLICYYINLTCKKKKNHVVNMENINLTINLYCLGLFNYSKLFWISLIELVFEKYYILFEENNKLYLKKIENSNIQVNKYQKVFIQYIDNFLNEDNIIMVEQLDQKVRSDYNFDAVLNNFVIALKYKTKTLIGDIDRFSNYILPIIFTFLYSLQVLYFLNVEINFLAKILISLPFTLFTIIICNLLRNKLDSFNKKNICFFLLLFVISLITNKIWNNNMNNNYLIFHFIMGSFTYSYPILIIINVYFIKMNCFCKNKIQQDLTGQMYELKNAKQDNINYVYLKCLKIKTNKKDMLIDEYFKILDI